MENLAIVKGMYNAAARADFPAFLGAMDAAIEWKEAENFPYADRNPYIGPQAVAEGVFGRIAADWEYWTLSDLQFHDTKEDMIIVTGRYNAKNNATEKIIKVPFTPMWRLKNDKATSFQQYADTYQVNKAMVN